MATSFTAACKNFFDYREGQGASDFVKEMKALTQRDKEEIHAAFKAYGIECDAPMPLAPKVGVVS